MNRLSRTLLLDVVAPLAVFYGLRAAGASPLAALVAGAVLPLAGAVRDLAARRRPDGVRLFVLAVMASTVAASLITGSPRALLVRSAVLMAALGVFLLLTRRSFLYTAAHTVLPPDKQRIWQDNWDRHPPFRRVLSLLGTVWAAGCLLDAAIRLTLALTLPVDSVPALDAVLLVVTLILLMLIQRTFGRAYLNRHGLRLRGVVLEPYPQDRPSTPPPLARTGTPPPARTGTPPPARTGTPPPVRTGTPPPVRTGTPPPARPRPDSAGPRP